MNYTQDQQMQIVENLIASGWTFASYAYTPIVKGWWIKASGNAVESMRRGDPKPFHAGAIATAELYAPEALP